MACMLEGAASQVSVADDVLELAVSVTSMQSSGCQLYMGYTLVPGAS